MITLEPFKIQHYAEIERANGVGLEHWGILCGIFPVLRTMERGGTWWTMRRSGKILIIGGYHSVSPRVCEVSLYPSRDFVACPVVGFRELKKQLIEKTKSFMRVQMTCEERFRNWGKHLVITQEGILWKFGADGRDHVIMAIVR